MNIIKEMGMYLERRRKTLSFLVKDERSVFHLSGCEESDISGARKLLWSFPCRIVIRGRNAADRAYSIEMICDQ